MNESQVMSRVRQTSIAVVAIRQGSAANDQPNSARDRLLPLWRLALPAVVLAVGWGGYNLVASGRPLPSTFYLKEAMSLPALPQRLSAGVAGLLDQVPPMYADTTLAWEGKDAGYPDGEVRVHGASLAGRPVWFQVQPSWELPPAPTPGIIGWLSAIAIPGALFCAFLFARRNLRQGRVDRRGARRLVWAVIIWFVAWWIFAASHTLASIVPRLTTRIGMGMIFVSVIWVVYVAIEPFVRRRWPDLLVSWARLLEGRWRDPLVGRDLLLGAAFGVFLAGLDELAFLAPRWFNQPLGIQGQFLFDAMLGGRMAVAQELASVATVFVVLLALLVLVLVRMVTRSTWIAFAGSTFALFLFFAGSGQNNYASALFLLLFSVAMVTLLLRFGLLAAATGTYLHSPLAHGSITPNLGAWYADVSILTLVLITAVALYGFYTSFGGRSLIAEGALEDA
jgi:hypothetical protein